MKHINILVVLILLWHQCFSHGNKFDNDVNAKIKQVEAGLRHAIQINGEPFPIFTITERMKYHNVPAVSIALINDGKIEWAKGYGYLAMDSMKKVDTLTLFQAASISKPVAALAALKLVDQQKINLDEDVNTYLKTWKIQNTSFTEKNPVTLRGLLTHTAGLTVHGFIGYTQGNPLPTLTEILNGEKPANSPIIMLDSVPGSLWRYSGGGYVLMQQLLEDVTETDFPTLMQRSVLSPIGMKHSTFQQTLPPSWQERTSIGHQSDGKKLPGNWNIYPESAAAGLWTTPSDLGLYIIEIQKSLQNESNQVLSKSMIEQMLTKHLGDWGLGPGIRGENNTLAFSHGGSNEGFRCTLFAFAYSGQGAVVMTNSDNGMELVDEIIRSIAITYDWSARKPIMKNRVVLSPSKLATFTGTYLTKQFNVSLLLTIQGNDLVAKQLWNEQEFILYPESDLDFFIKENGFLIKFELSTNGTVIGLILLDLKWIKIE